MTADASTQITELTTDDHACLTFGETEELYDLTAAFIRDGLVAGLKVMWVSDAGPALAVRELTRRGIVVEPAMAAGQLTATDLEGRLLSGQAFSTDAALRWLGGQLITSREQGFPGLRIAMDMSWALRPVAGIEQLPRFEEGIAEALTGSAAAVLCQYDRERFDPVTLASVAGSHTRSVAAATYYADATLRICRQYAPPGIRIAGELDYQAEEPLSLALAEAVRLEGDLVINISALTFIDARCSLLIADAVRAMTNPRKVTVRCAPEVASGFIRLGVADVPGVHLVTVDEY